MDDEYREQLREQLREKRRVLHILELKLARQGMCADPSVIMEAEDIRDAVAAIEARLGIEWPAPPRAARRHEAPMPAPLFERAVGDRQERARQESIKHELTMLELHRQNLKHYRNQQQQMGAFAPPMVTHGLREARTGIHAAKDALRGYGVDVDDLSGDE